MGILDSIGGFLSGLSSGDNSSGETCPECGCPLRSDGGPDDRGTERFECTSGIGECAEPVWFRESGGPLITPWERRASGAPKQSCESCQRDMSGSEFTAAWEDGNNSNAYVTCRHCGHQNVQWGWGGD
jgi:hypothetical protein